MLRLVTSAMLALLCGPALANDSIAELSTGGLVLQDSAGIRMLREHLRLSPDQVAVDYVFRNETAQDIAATVAFPMPEITGSEDMLPAIPDPEGANFLDFQVMWDGKPVTPELSARALHGGADITAELAARGVPPLPFGSQTAAALASLPADVARDWAARGLIAEQEYDAGQGRQTDRLPLWTLQSAWHWPALFPAGREIAVSHRYRPSLGQTVAPQMLDPGTGRPGGPLLADYRRRYCTEDDFLRAAERRIAAGDTLIEQRLAYVLGTGGNWASGRIGDFVLTVDKGRPDALVSFCGRGVSKTGATSFEMRASDFAPPDMLEVLFLSPGGA